MLSVMNNLLKPANQPGSSVSAPVMPSVCKEIKKITYNSLRKVDVYFIPQISDSVNEMKAFKENPRVHYIDSMKIEEIPSVSSSLEKIAAAIIDKEVNIDRNKKHVVVVLHVKPTANKDELEVEYILNGQTKILNMVAYKDYELACFHKNQMISAVTIISDATVVATTNEIIKNRKL